MSASWPMSAQGCGARVTGMPVTGEPKNDHRIDRSRRVRPERVHTAPTRGTGAARRRERQRPLNSRRRSLLLMSGVAYLLAWAVGLAVFSSSTLVRSTGEQVLSDYAGHRGLVSLQFVLTEGVTGVLLAVVLGHLGVFVGGRLGRVIGLTGLAAAAISIAQCGLGVVLATRILSRHDADAAGAVYDLLTRLDGVKMLLLAVSAGATALAIGRSGAPLPSWLAAVGTATGAAISVSGVGYLALEDALATAAYVSLPLLIVFITGSAVCLGRPRGATGTSVQA